MVIVCTCTLLYSIHVHVTTCISLSTVYTVYSLRISTDPLADFVVLDRWTVFLYHAHLRI